MPQQKQYHRKALYPVMPCTKRPFPIILGGDPNLKNFLYCHGKSVIIRNIEQPSVADVYTEHSDTVTVAKYSPNGRYIASGDTKGHLRIWNSFYDFHPLEKHYRPFEGIIKDIAWSPDNQRIVVAGKSPQCSGKVLLFETGATICDLAGARKGNTTCDFRPKKSFRFATGSEDSSISFYEGPPFKYKFSKFSHTSVVHTVRFSPDGKLLASAGFDGKVFLYDAKTFGLVVEVGKPAHKGIVTGLSWSPDSSQLLTCSEDGTCNLWDVESNTLFIQFKMGGELLDQQVACLWQGDFLLSVSLSGNINYLNKDNPLKPSKVITGHSQPLSGLAVNSKRSGILTASDDGLINFWYKNSGENKLIYGKGHEAPLNDMVVQENHVFTCGNDYCIRQISLDTKSFTKYWVKLNSKPIGLGLMKGDIIAVACQKKLFLVQYRAIIFSMPISYHATYLTANTSTNELAIGGHDMKVHMYKVEEGALEHQYDLEHEFQINCCAFSPDDKHLVVCDAGGKVSMYSTKNGKFKKHRSWNLTHDVITAVAWCPNSTSIATASVDFSISIHSAYNPIKQIVISNAHGTSVIPKLAWLDEHTLVSVGQDCNAKIWSIDT